MGMRSWIVLSVLMIALGILVVLAFDKWMLFSEERRRQARLERPEGTGPSGAVGSGAFGVGFEVWQPGYKNHVDEQQRLDNWIEQAESGAPPRDVDLDKGVAVIKVPKKPDPPQA